ncbi:HhH-GPD-type base excision DNA repair protein [Catellatospora bangladeshensis]|uniref:HhH-GPD-type base excision DNA repair protein n=1 Tax=Catellatospora bangladeshensis TaxID=310355 RepID=UPI001EF30886|nr:HhH-GPD-type base excision DNA repair protein [Catellatospora bangladeshensis]
MAHILFIVALHLAQDEEVDRRLADDPLALLIGMLLHDDQHPVERAFMAPVRLAERLGVERLTVTHLCEVDMGLLTAAFAKVPVLHPFPAVKAQRVRRLCEHLTRGYGGDGARVWADPLAWVVLARLRELPGFDRQKAQIFLALLGKRLGVRPQGWQAAAGRYGTEDVFLSVADISDDVSLGRVRQYRKRLVPEASEPAWSTGPAAAGPAQTAG